MPVYTRTELEGMRDKDLKKMAFNQLGITGISKKPKAQAINMILEQQAATHGAAAAGVASVSPKTTKRSTGPIDQFHAGVAAKKTGSGASASSYSTTIQVSCGASSGNFPVVGKTVGEVRDFLKEILNIDTQASGLVNGEKTNNDHVLQDGDKLEFVKAAGKKGC